MKIIGGESKPRVLFVGDQPDWAFDHVARQVQRAFCGQYDIEVIGHTDRPSWDTVDTVCWMWWRAALILRGLVRAKRVCVGMYDDYTIERHPQEFQKVLPLADCFFAGNERIAADLARRAPGKQIILVEDGVDLKLFSPQPFPDKFTVGWTGNNMYGRMGYGDLKGVQLIREACRQLGVPLIIQDKQVRQIPHVAMPAEFYRNISCYVCASRCEGTPNPVLEALACGRPVVTTDVGIVRKLVTDDRRGYIVERSVEAIAAAIDKVRCRHTSLPLDADSRVPRDFAWAEKVKAYGPVLGDSAENLGAALDLSNEVTVFAVTVGDETNYRHCLENLALQDCRFRLEVIDHVAPAAAAFQRMTDTCETPYYVQVDEDMILDPSAVRTLYDGIRNAPTVTAIFCAPLWDVHLRRALLGVKMYRSAFMRTVTFRQDVPHCDVVMNAQLREAGYDLFVRWTSADDRAQCVGRHGVHYTPATIYEAYFNRALATRAYPESTGWLRQLPSYFVAQMQSDPNDELHLYALLGYVAGLNVDLEKCSRKDFRIIDPAWVRIRDDLAEVTNRMFSSKN